MVLYYVLVFMLENNIISIISIRYNFNLTVY